MSYDIRLVDKKSREVLSANFTPRRQGTYALDNGGECRCAFNITYNYAPHFYRVIDEEKGVRKIYGMTAKESVLVLAVAIAKLGRDVSDDYWEATEGNAREALRGLLDIAMAADPEGVWEGD